MSAILQRSTRYFRSAHAEDTLLIKIDQRHDTGPFDIIGDVHGCADELELLLAQLGYELAWSGEGPARTCVVNARHERRVIFVGDLVDRGPRTPDVLRIAMSMSGSGLARCVIGNHDAKFLRWLTGSNVQIANGLAQSIAQMEHEAADFRGRAAAYLSSLPVYLWLDEGRLVVAHAGIREDMIGLDGNAVRSFCLFGDTTGETDAYGLPVRRDWAAHYRGRAHIVYGHTPMVDAIWINRTICLDTGCVFGGKLTALRWPERDLISVPAARTYTAPTRPLGQHARTT